MPNDRKMSGIARNKKWAKLTKQKVAKYCNKKLKFALTANINLKINANDTK